MGMPDEKEEIRNNIVHLARLGLAGDRRNIEIYLRRMLRNVAKADSALAGQLSQLLATAPTVAAPLREAGGGFAPVDQDSRLQLLKHENPVVIEHEPILSPAIASALNLVLSERTRFEELVQNGLKPTRTLLFTGKPGVGKTLSARWLAAQLGKPLLTLDLATVISSFLGRTGTNLRHVLDYAKSVDSILFLDEFDAIAKRRGDETELGELKRIVTVLLQEIDAWPSDKLLIAATNHAELLDRAVWRRFDLVLDFPLPTSDQVQKTLDVCFGERAGELGEWRTYLAELARDKSFSDIERLAYTVRRRILIGGTSFEDAMIESIATEWGRLPLAQRKQLGAKLSKRGLSDRKINLMLGVSRDTLRSMKRKISTE